MTTDCPDDRADEQIERAAKALFDVRDDEFDLDEWDELLADEKERWICDARALDAAGLLAAPADQDELRTYKRGAKTLGHIIEQQCRMALDATGLHDWIDGGGDWGAVWENLIELKPRAERAEAEVDRLRDIIQGLYETNDEANATTHKALAKVRAVRELHREHECTGYPDCMILFSGECAHGGHCNQCRQAWPCPTVRALDTAGGGDDE